jgi:hypothetical protein
MISINVEKPAVTEKEAEASISRKNMLRKAKEDADKKMSAEKYERLKRAGLVK